MSESHPPSDPVPVDVDRTAPAPGDSTAGLFTLNEKVLVLHIESSSHKKFYEAKIQKCELRGENGWFYFLHYTVIVALLLAAAVSA